MINVIKLTKLLIVNINVNKLTKRERTATINSTSRLTDTNTTQCVYPPTHVFLHTL